MATDAEPGAVLAFWFDEIRPADWWSANAGFDERVRSRFGALHEQACRCELSGWRTSAVVRMRIASGLICWARRSGSVWLMGAKP